MKKFTLIMTMAALLLQFAQIKAQTKAHIQPNESVCLSPNTQKQDLKYTKGVLSLLEENFSGVFPPSGWTIIGDGQTNWQSSSSSNAGGAPPEAMFTWTPSFEGNSKLASVAVNTSGMDVVILQFSHMVDDYSGDYTLNLETTSDGTTWNSVWSENITGNIEAETLSFIINNDDVGSADFQFAFTYDGNSYNINQWYIDDVTLSEALGLDAGVSALVLPPLVPENEPVIIESVVNNFGTEEITFDAVLEIKEGSNVVFSDIQTVENLQSLDEQVITFEAWSAQVGTYEVSVETQLTGDENPENDMMSGDMQVITGVVLQKPLFEEFTSSTCAPCAVANPIINGVLNNNQDEYSLIKYQMDWPGIGDPYYTDQGGVRRDYYSVVAVPFLYGNAIPIDPAASMSQEIFDDLASQLTGIEIIVDAEIDDDFVVTVNAQINAFADYPAGMRAHIVVVEKTTYGNVSTNGESSFNHVMMAMLPDAEGTEISELNPGSQVILTESYDMTETFMEQPNDLLAVVFVQDNSDQSVIQSEMTDITGEFTTYSVTFSVEDSNGNPMDGATVDFGINGPQSTNASGQAVYETVFPGSYEYEVIKSGFLPGTGTVEVTDQDVTVDVVLEIPDFFFFEDFDAGLPAEWTKYISSGNTNNLYWYDGFIVFWMQNSTDEHIILVTPELNLTQAGTLFFEAGEIYSTPSVSIGTMTDPEDPDSFEEVANLSLSSVMEEYTVVLEGLNITDPYLAFKYDGPPEGYFYFDNVKISTSSMALAAPTGLTASVEDTDVLLEWTAPGKKGLLGYNIYRDNENIAFAEETSYLDAGLENGLYTYYVTAVYDEGESGGSNTVTANVGNVLVYCEAWGGCDQYISNIQLGSIDNSSDCTEYGDYMELSTQLDIGETYTLGVNIGSASTGDDIGVWIDFNQDGEFGEEENLVCEMNNSQGNFDFEISVPEDALAGTTRMRVRVKYWGEDCEPCGSSTWGETEDYSVEIMVPTDIATVEQRIVKIFPNPAKNKVTIRSDVPVKHFFIYSYTGQVLAEGNPESRNATVELVGFKPGIYLIRLETEKGFQSQQLMVE